MIAWIQDWYDGNAERLHAALATLPACWWTDAELRREASLSMLAYLLAVYELGRRDVLELDQTRQRLRLRPRSRPRSHQERKGEPMAKLPQVIPLRTKLKPQTGPVYEMSHEGSLCGACAVPFRRNDRSVAVVLGPADDENERAAMRDGRAYSSAAILVHVACAGVVEENDDGDAGAA